MDVKMRCSEAASSATSTCSRDGFRITTRKLPILKSGPIEDMTNKLGIAPPEMIFGDNHVTIAHLKSGWQISFNAFDALDRVDKTGGSMLQVAYSKEWQKNRERHTEGIKEVVKPFDWSFSTDYKGTIRKTDAQHLDLDFKPTNHDLPMHLLRLPDPILFFDDVMLYEDELADNGLSMVSVKIRVMPERLLLLSRFFMRLDDVVFRIRDTRVFVEFKTGEVLREYQAWEGKFEDVKSRLMMQHGGREAEVLQIMRDANGLLQAGGLKIVDETRERLELPVG
ncbi:TIP41-domain-containing protein [Eremomyces bilateralis CBS 781.70]|uniref:TIP41-domain-containing protein n=1 Tax=Eremomyces bilateralis CBS 781.70 TaxID=1392243 RepID=A0A6G1G1C9_9PEZI|nr:TIP41-domain-containing protein [Eremomyces bilateralis CBS 781.70]KAF1811915.1 TIP41-domain-containing protein [Eremomyces bilateralis CBS 781.70]